MQQQLKEAFGAGQASTAWMHLDLMVLLVPFKLRVFYDFFSASFINLYYVLTSLLFYPTLTPWQSPEPLCTFLPQCLALLSGLSSIPQGAEGFSPTTPSGCKGLTVPVQKSALLPPLSTPYENKVIWFP